MKYNKSQIMKRAWEMKKSWSARSLTFGECLKRAWDEAKKVIAEVKYYGVQFVNNMTVTADGYERTLTRWTKGNNDRVYINSGNRAGDGYVDIKTGVAHLRGNLTYQKKIADMILSMTF